MVLELLAAKKASEEVNRNIKPKKEPKQEPKQVAQNTIGTELNGSSYDRNTVRMDIPVEKFAMVAEVLRTDTYA